MRGCPWVRETTEGTPRGVPSVSDGWRGDYRAPLLPPDEPRFEPLLPDELPLDPDEPPLDPPLEPLLPLLPL